MSKYLIIIESPGKIHSFEKYLSKDYKIIASIGHLFDLPEKKLSIDIKNDFEPTFEILDGKEDILKNIISESKKAEIVYIMTDGDREGAGIGGLICQYLPTGTKVKRAKAYAITKNDIQKAISDCYDIKEDNNLYNAFIARRVLDRIVGYRTSFLTKQATGGASAGRTQSAGLRILVEREKEINTFIPVIYWPIEAELLTGKKEKIYSVIKKPKPLDISTQEEALKIISVLKSKPIIVSKYEIKEVKANAYPPFTTSTLQQAASSILGFSPDRTMKAAQQLYQAGACVLEDELVVMSDGRIIEIKDAKKETGLNAKGFEEFDKKHIKNNNWLVQNSLIKDYQELEYDNDIYKIRTLDGQEISTTFDHKLLCFDGDDVLWKKTEDLKDKDFLLCSKNIPVNRKNKPKTIFDFIINLKKCVLKNIHIQISNDELVDKLTSINKNNININSYYKYKSNKRLPILWFIDYIKENNYNFDDFVIYIEYYSWALGGGKPEMFSPEDFCYLLGFCLGDGHITKTKGIVFARCIMSDSKWEILHNKFNILDNKEYNKDRRNVFEFSGQILKNLCIHYGGSAAGKKCDKIYIHPFISGLCNDLLYTFMAGLFDSDGCIRTVGKRINISYTTISQKMAKQLNCLFRTLGYASGIHRRKSDIINCSIKILECSHKEFINNIVKHLFVKKEYVQEIIIPLLKNNTVQNFNFPLINYIEKRRKEKKLTKLHMSQVLFGDRSTYWNYLRIVDKHTRAQYITPKILKQMAELLEDEFLFKLSLGDMYFTPIKRIVKEKYSGKVYDITTSSGNFICNTFYSHNCTYHRTDSLHISADFISAMRTQISNNYDKEYLPSSAIFYKTKSKSAQEAHEAIRPTDITANSWTSSGIDEKKLYELIWRRSVASQMAPARYERRSSEFSCEKHVLAANGSKEMFDGFRKVWTYGGSDDKYLPDIKIGDIVDIIEVKTEEHKTQPPPRYSEASFIKELERVGIGRPATYASIPKTLINRGYIVIGKQKTLNATDLGIKVCDFLIAADFCFIDIKFTAELEDKLDDISCGKLKKTTVLNEFWTRLKKDIENSKAVKKDINTTEYKCPKCGSYLAKKHSKFGDFISCSNYPECKGIYVINENNEPVEKVAKKKEYSDIPCPKCGFKMVKRKSKFGEFLGCEKYPKCKTILDMQGNEVQKSTNKKPFKKYKKKK